MNKKIYLAAFALPLFVAACSSEDVLVESQKVNQYEGIATVDAKFGLDGTESRLATQWGIEAGKDILGFAWLGDGGTITVNGKAYQNHPLYAASGNSFQPETSIYVGKYYTYHPYDYSTKGIQPVTFSVAEQDMLAEYNDLAKTSIWISPKWTNVTLEGDEDEKDKAGVNETFNIYPRQFSNYANLFMTYKNNTPVTGAPEIKSIKVSYLDGTEVISANGFSYAPTTELYTAETSAAIDYWNQKELNGLNGVTATKGAITLIPAEEYLATGNSYRVRYNALPAAATVTADTKVKFELETTYGKIEYTFPLKEVAKTADSENKFLDNFDGAEKTATLPAGLSVAESFVQKLYKTGRFDFEVDFFDAVMDGMHVANDAELQKMLNYYKTYKKGSTAYSEEKEGTDIKLYLDGNPNADGAFKLSKTSIALIQEINKDCTSDLLVSIQKCKTTGSHNTCSSIQIVDGGELPELFNVFENNDNVSLGAGAWTWSETPADNEGNVIGKNFGKVTQITVSQGATLTLANNNIKAAGTTFNKIVNVWNLVVSGVVNVEVDVDNMYVITINENAKMLAKGAVITNKSLTYNGQIINYKIINNGVLGVVNGTNGKVVNYGYIKNNEGAKTYVTMNQTNGADFAQPFSSTNMIGTIELTTMFDDITVAGGTGEGFIKYTWAGESIYSTPEDDFNSIKYNYLIVDKNIKFTEFEKEVMYLEVAANSNIVIVAESGIFTDAKRLKGFILGENAVATVKEGSEVLAKAAYIHEGTLYVGGQFWYNNDLTTYLGGVDSDKNNIIKHQ